MNALDFQREGYEYVGCANAWMSANDVPDKLKECWAKKHGMHSQGPSGNQSGWHTSWCPICKIYYDCDTSD